jgi:hypothetical protein
LSDGVLSDDKEPTMNRTPAWTSSLLLALASIGVAAGLGACSSQGAGDSVVTEQTSHIVWKSEGGSQIEIPASAPCHFESSYDLDVHTGTLAWSVCSLNGNNFSDPSAYVTTTGSRTLTNDEKTQATVAASAVKVSNVTTCGADLDSRSLDVNGTSGSITYGDDFYACDKLYQHYVQTEPLNNLGIALGGMAHSP